MLADRQLDHDQMGFHTISFPRFRALARQAARTQEQFREARSRARSRVLAVRRREIAEEIRKNQQAEYERLGRLPDSQRIRRRFKYYQEPSARDLGGLKTWRSTRWLHGDEDQKDDKMPREVARRLEMEMQIREARGETVVRRGETAPPQQMRMFR